MAVLVVVPLLIFLSPAFPVRMDDAEPADRPPSPGRASLDRRVSLPLDDDKDPDQEGDQESVIMSDNDEDISLGLELDEEASDLSGNRVPIFINVTRTSPIPPELRPNGHAGNGE